MQQASHLLSPLSRLWPGRDGGRLLLWCLCWSGACMKLGLGLGRRRLCSGAAFLPAALLCEESEALLEVEDSVLPEVLLRPLLPACLAGACAGCCAKDGT